MKRTLAFCWTALFLCFGMQSLCFAGEKGEKTANIPASEDYIGCWSTDGAAAVIRPSGSRFEVILETYDCGPDGFIYGYLCDYREEEGVLEARGTGIKRFSGWDEAREQEIAQTEYEDGSAVFQINEEGLLIWKDRTGNAGEGLLFSGMGDFEGTWVCGGISIDFYPIGGIYDCWIDDADQGCSWRYFCSYDPKTDCVVSDIADGWKEFHDQTEPVYMDGEAVFRMLEDGTLRWEDKKENAGKDMVFIRVESRWTSSLLR